jgi:hypothetical protein
METFKPVPPQEDFDIHLGAGGINSIELKTNLEKFVGELRTRKTDLHSAEKLDDITLLPSSLVLDQLLPLSSKLEGEARHLEQIANPEELAAQTMILQEMETKKWLSQNREAVSGEVLRLRLIALLDHARELTDTTALSRKKSQLTEELITDAYIKRFDEEIMRLGAQRIPVSLMKTKSERGRVYHQIKLRNARSRIKTSEVLSEGEFRIISLAAFLADVEGRTTPAPFVFDDPISSLDQDFEEATVARLLHLTKSRQVIVFTHRLSLMVQLEEAAKKNGMDPTVIALRAEPWGIGEPGDTPLNAKDPKKAINALMNQRLAKARKELAQDGNAAYDISAKAICSDARILIERVIETTLLGDVVQRFRRAVHTQRLVKLIEIKPDDCRFLDQLMTKYSRYEHAQPDEAPVSLPQPDEIETDLLSLKDWIEGFEKRGKKSSSSPL